MDLEERWVEIEDFPNYSISNNGRVMNNKTRRLLSFWFINSGYLCVGLWCAKAIGGRQSTIQRLINGIGKSHMGYRFERVD